MFTRSAIFDFYAEHCRQDEMLYLARVPASSFGAVDRGGWTELELDVIDELRWWSLDDLDRVDIEVFPDGLVDLVRGLLPAWDGDDAAPRAGARVGQVTGLRVVQAGSRCSPRVQHVAQRPRGRDHVRVGQVGRGDAEAHDVGRAEVADHPARGERLHDPVGVGVPQRDLRAAEPRRPPARRTRRRAGRR